MAINATVKSEHKATLDKARISPTKKNAAERAVEESNRQKELYFKATHTLLIAFLLWILYVNLNG